MSGISGATDLDVSEQTSCALVDGVAWCWRKRVGPSPVAQTPTSLTASMIATSDRGVCFVRSGDLQRVWCMPGWTG